MDILTTQFRIFNSINMSLNIFDKLGEFLSNHAVAY